MLALVFALAAFQQGPVVIEERPRDQPAVVRPVVPPPIVMSRREPAYLSRIYSAREAVMTAADSAPRGHLGRFAFTVRALGWDRGRLYLNSEEDYRDPRNLSVSIPPEVAKAMITRLGGNEQESLVGKTVIVTGRATRTRVELIAEDGKRTSKYYYQTQVPIFVEHDVVLINLRR